MNAIMVCVNYTDIAAITIPYNRHHFDRVVVVTDTDTICSADFKPLCEANRVEPFVTNSFYDDGATFNKWKALEEALTEMDYRRGWLCLMDADVLWPKNVSIFEFGDESGLHIGLLIPDGKGLQPRDRSKDNMVKTGQLCSPLRRMWNDWPNFEGKLGWQGAVPLQESEWSRFPIHRNVAEFAGYSQIFHASDPHLRSSPWHQTDWKHAGGADSFFQEKWPTSHKIRPPFEVLHLGPAGKNWYGRATMRADGTIPADAAEKLAKIGQIWERRRGRMGEERFRDEKILGK